ncbi:tripartite tricarboxylate transporter substrate binding protein [Variovorax ginsengisoli]|uniref:Tripartite tricarboxylate transporter substrate binding protein n=1 Tax=Variovorax ginsengisoli TaxID=363844 RepID=A0ABT8SCP6_9BURK|nr:tripartite tricarboxylate transporter substrate binding protein [Variovorax ginsengisoli]MDN8617514.1 tripartite tricarboxylate transporter substrate binding protein [Variovorax ginsengisoli]MDO1536684.1 tripartite tricarboxylate transporter substrate binding protein [Variovorax ginsengisoli]
MRQIRRILIGALLSLCALHAVAQSDAAKARLKALKPGDYPTHPIELSVGYAAGGGMDIVARLVAQKFQDYTGETLIINNRPGAGGLLFHRWILTQAAANGYFIGVANNVIIDDSLLRSEGKWSYRDADNLAFINLEPVLWFASTTGRFKDRSLADIIQAAKNEPSSVRVATVSATMLEMLAEQVEQKASIQLMKVPYNSGKPSLAALMGNHIDISFGFIGEVQGLEDKLRPIGVASETPLPALPEVPTFNAVLGAKDVNWLMWRYVMAPKGLPVDRKNWLVACFSEVMKDRQLNAELEKLGGIPNPNIDTPQRVSAELDRMASAERSFYVQTGRLK